LRKPTLAKTSSYICKLALLVSCARICERKKIIQPALGKNFWQRCRSALFKEAGSGSKDCSRSALKSKFRIFRAVPVFANVYEAQESIQLAHVVWRAGKKNRVVLSHRPARLGIDSCPGKVYKYRLRARGPGALVGLYTSGRRFTSL
jgi:hypothetical protein